jgi:hypothetical protein
LTWSAGEISLQSFGPAQINARSPITAHAALIPATVSAEEPSGVLPKPK